MSDGHRLKCLLLYCVRQALQAKTQLSLQLCTVNMLSYQISEGKRTTPKGKKHVTERELLCTPWFIEELHRSAAASTLFFFNHHWSELLGKNSCCQPPHLYCEFVGVYFKIYHHPGVGGSCTPESRCLTKATLCSGYASGRETSKWSNSTCNINFAFQDNSDICVTC